jgi:hypothetical protein
MDVLYFLKERTRFIRYVFDGATAQFSGTKQKIEREEPPFEPPYSEDGEPPFLEEWLEAEEGFQVVGRLCVSMLSATLQLYFKTWEGELGLVWQSAAARKRAFEQGFVAGYRRAFGEVLNLSWDECPADFNVLEQIALARNRDQHPDHLSMLSVAHRYEDLRRFAEPIFLSEGDRNRLAADPDAADVRWLTPAIHVSREGLMVGIAEVEKLAEWLEERMIAKKFAARR